MNLMEGMVEEVKRVKENVMPIYKEIGSAGAFALALMENTVTRAEKAIGEGDTLGMLSIYKELQEIQP